MSRSKRVPPSCHSFFSGGLRGHLMHYYQFHIGDYKSHTHHLTPMEDLAFRRLLDHYYLHEVPIKKTNIARQIGLKDFEQEVLSILDEFFVSTLEGFINPRADIEINKYKEFSIAGKKGAAIRWSKGGNREANSPPNATPIATINQEPLPNNHKPITNIKIQAPQGVSLEVWESFLAQRKLSRAAVTETVIKAIKRESEKAGWSLEQTLTEIVSRGWRGFKAEWVQDNPKTQNKSFYQTDLEIKQKRHDDLVGKTRSQLIDITPENFLEMK